MASVRSDNVWVCRGSSTACVHCCLDGYGSNLQEWAVDRLSSLRDQRHRPHDVLPKILSDFHRLLDRREADVTVAPGLSGAGTVLSEERACQPELEPGPSLHRAIACQHDASSDEAVRAQEGRFYISRQALTSAR